MIGINSSGILRIPYLENFLSDEVVDIRVFKRTNNITTVAGWGRKQSYYDALRLSQKNNFHLLSLEDGFIRSMGLGGESVPLSLIVDDVGIYFDAYHPSRLEQLILVEEAQKQRAAAAIQLIRTHKISKYNHAPAFRLDVDPDKKNVLIIDQSMNDQSIKFSGANSNSFMQMLNSAIATHKNATIWIKTHPDVLAGKRKGHFSDLSNLNNHDIRFISVNANPIDLMEQVDSVYVVSSHMGFEALLLGKQVYCFGMSWYAGWGLTNDSYAPVDIVQQRRSSKRSLVQLFSAAYFSYAKYIDPVTGDPCQMEEVLHSIIKQKQWKDLFNSQIQAIGFSPWKRTFIRDYLSSSSKKLTFRKNFPRKSDNKVSYISWGNKNNKKFTQLHVSGSHVYKVEDGFIRSVGLGANLIRPLSLVFDAVGIYYDPSRPSTLENILNTIQLTDSQIQRAENIRSKIVAANLSKYNVGKVDFKLTLNKDKTVIMVPGQVEDDASILLGCADIRTNLDLLIKVRQQNPDAWIIYKPHPDVEAGLRPGLIKPSMLKQYADDVAVNVDMPSCLNYADEVHTLTSLTGFEALLRGKKVHCYGMPFYAGWGLTYDYLQCERRRKKLNLLELIYAVLVSYPVYKLPNTEFLANVEQVIDYISAQRERLQSDRNHNKSLLARLRALAVYRR